MNEELNAFSWTLKRSFYFESHESMQDVTQALTMLKGSKSFGGMPDTIAISSTSDGYTFHYEVRRWEKYRRSSTTAFADGEIWQHINGTVVIEGTAQVNPWDFYGTLIVSALLGLTMAISMRVYALVWALILLGYMLFILFIYYDDRNRVIELMAQVLTPEKPERKSAV